MWMSFLLHCTIIPSGGMVDNTLFTNAYRDACMVVWNVSSCMWTLLASPASSTHDPYILLISGRNIFFNQSTCVQMPHLVVTITQVCHNWKAVSCYTYCCACKKQRGEACLHSLQYSYHGLCLPPSLEHSHFHRFPSLGSTSMGSQ